jgi:sulfonate transport system ATP-binding protein
VLGLPREQSDRQHAISALEEVGLADHVMAWPRTLSGGEAQRVALARALARHPGLLLLDEPFAALDALTRMRMQDLVNNLIRRHRPAALLVTHDVDEAILLADRVVVLKAGRLSVDVRVEIEGRRARMGPEFLALRQELLGQLGVSAETIPGGVESSAHDVADALGFDEESLGVLSAS